MAELFAAHEVATGALNTLSSFSSEKLVQSTECHETLLECLKSKSSIRSQNLMLSGTMPHASDWLIAPPIHRLELGLQSDVFCTALKFRLSMPLFDEPYPCPALSREGKVCGDMMDVFGDHAPCCHHGPSLLFRHNNERGKNEREARKKDR